MQKNMRAAENNHNGFDLVVERDAGNEVRILTGKKSLEFWKDLKRLSEETVYEIEWGIYKNKNNI